MQDSYWIKPDGDVIHAPSGHQSYIQEHWQEHDLPVGIALTDLIVQGWVRISSENVILRQVENPEVLTNLKQLLITLGYDKYTFWINGKPYVVSLDMIESTPIVDIYRDMLAGKLEHAADADDQGIFEYQPSWGESESDGSTGIKDRGVEFMPQDYTKEVWWNRELLDYLRKNFPGKKDVIPPEPDIGYPSQASDVVERMKKKAKYNFEFGEYVRVDKGTYPVYVVDERLRYRLTSLTEIIDTTMDGVIFDKFSDEYLVSLPNKGGCILVHPQNLKETFPEEDAEVRKWEERWHKRSMLKKQAKWVVDGVWLHYESNNLSDCIQRAWEHHTDVYEPSIKRKKNLSDDDKQKYLLAQGYVFEQIADEDETRRWEERWHRHGGLEVQAEVYATKINKLQEWTDANRPVPKSYSGHHASYELDTNYILHLYYYSTEIVTADMKNKIILKVTTGGHYSVSTKARIRQILQAFYNLGYPEIRDVRYEYDSTESEADRDAEEARLEEQDRKWRNQAARERYKRNVVQRREMQRLKDQFPKEFEELRSGDYGYVSRIDEEAILNHIKRKEEQKRLREQYPEAYDALIKETYKGYITPEAIEKYLEEKKTREWEERWTRRKALREKDKIRMAIV
jgi:hypothetical protein